MREIKFRAWDKMKKIMSEVTEITWDTGEGNGISTKDYVGSWDRFELMQYTGVKDIHGKGIYEGDIYLNNENEDDLPTETVVKFEFGKFILTDRETQKRYLEDLVNIEGKVIGNIYENPELIKT